MALKDIIAKVKAEEDAKKLAAADSPQASADIHELYPDPPDVDDLIEDDTTFNLRLNSVLKKEFARICKRDHLSAASALKRYMTDCVRYGMLK